MGFVVVISNYLVQIPIKHLGLSEILTYGAFTYPITFLITDLANRAYGKIVARKIVYVGFTIGILLTLFLSKICTSRCWAIKNATPEPIAILIDMISEKFVDRNKVKSIPIVHTAR